VDSGSTPADGGPGGGGGGSDAGDGGVEAASGPPGPPAAYITTDDLSQHLASTQVTLGDQASSDVTVQVDETMKYQSIVGFGASITDSSSYVMTKYLSATALQQLMVQLFDPAQGVGLTFLRQPMGASDFSSVGDFSYDDGNADPSMANFNVTQDLKATIPVLKQVLATSSDVFILGTPWSPPAWMKDNNSMDGTGGGGSSAGLMTTAYAPLAQYFVKYIQTYAKNGIPVSAITPQNEPLFGSGSYPGMLLDAPSELTLIAQNIGPAFASAGLKTQIWAYDHNWDQEGYPAQIMSDMTAGGFTAAAAFHCYAGDPSAMTTFHQAFPQKPIYMTECSGGDWQGDAFANTIDTILGSVTNWAGAVALWNMALDENAGPQNKGCPSCRGVVTVNSQSAAVTYNADYYALGHFSKFVRPGAVRVSSTASMGSLSQVAFQNGDGRIALVAHNTGGSTVAMKVGSGATAMTVSVPANAGVTLTWTPGVLGDQ
jgi:glucosylceramidase